MFNGYLLPIIVGLLILGVGYALFYMLPAVHDDGNSFLWIIGGFIILYIIAATYLGFKLPSPFAQAKTRNAQDTIPETTVTDVTVKPDLVTK